MVNGYVSTDRVVPSVENILCNKLNIQPFLVKYAGIYCTPGREYFPRPPASGNIPTFSAIYKTYYTGQHEILRDISRVATVLSRAEGEWKYKVGVK